MEKKDGILRVSVAGRGGWGGGGGGRGGGGRREREMKRNTGDQGSPT